MNRIIRSSAVIAYSVVDLPGDISNSLTELASYDTTNKSLCGTLEQ